MPRRPPTRGRGDPDPNALFDDDSDEGESAPLEPAARPREPTDTDVDDAKLPWDARLVVEKGDYAGKVLKLGGGTAMIGRSSKCELSLKGSSGVSRRHCKVQLVNDRYVVIDLESRNGTVVNGETVARKFLHDGDLLEIGDEHVRFIAKARNPTGKPLAPPPLDSEDIEDQPTALASPVGVQEPLVKPTPPSNASATTPKKGPSASPSPDGNTARKTSPASVKSARPAGAQPVPKKPPPLPPVDAPNQPSDQTASFVMDPAFLTPKASTSLSAAAARDGGSNFGGNTLENQPPELDDAEADEPSAPYTLQPQKRRSGGVVVALLVMLLLVLGIVGVAAWDVMFAERRVISFLRSRAPAAAAFLEKNVPHMGEDDSDDNVVIARDAGPASDVADAGAIAVADVDAGIVETVIDAGSAVAEMRDAGAAIVDAGSDAKVVDAGTKPVAVVTDGNDVTVGASSAGRVATVRVKVGDVVKKGQALAVLEAAGGLRRKLESLREEERAFEAAVKKGNKAARRDLEQVRADIAELTRRTKGAPLVSDSDGTVVEVHAREGATLKAGDPVVTLRR